LIWWPLTTKSKRIPSLRSPRLCGEICIQDKHVSFALNLPFLAKIKIPRNRTPFHNPLNHLAHLIYQRVNLKCSGVSPSAALGKEKPMKVDGLEIL
jgi:hypothetical protein